MTWKQLCDDSERRFGHPGARAYPFLSLAPLKDDRGPLVRTDHGPARVISVISEPRGRFRVEVLLELVLQNHLACNTKECPYPLRTMFLSLDRVAPPIEPPEPWRALTYGESGGNDG